MASKTVVIRFLAPVVKASVDALMQAIDSKLSSGVNQFTILISSPGGSVFHGLSAYNYLKGIPATVTTHNFGSVDSVAVVMFCGGQRRLSVPHARFLLHTVHASFEKGGLEEGQLEERLKGLRIDTENIARVVAANTGKAVEEVRAAMRSRSTLNPEEAQAWGLVHEIKSELFEPGSELIAIVDKQQQA